MCWRETTTALFSVSSPPGLLGCTLFLKTKYSKSGSVHHNLGSIWLTMDFRKMYMETGKCDTVYTETEWLHCTVDKNIPDTLKTVMLPLNINSSECRKEWCNFYKQDRTLLEQTIKLHLNVFESARLQSMAVMKSNKWVIYYSFGTLGIQHLF